MLKLKKNKFRLSDDIKKLNIVEVARYIGIDIDRTNHAYCIKGHDYKTRSLMFYPASNSCYCFGCGYHANVIKLVMDYKKIDYLDAISFLIQNKNKFSTVEIQDKPMQKSRPMYKGLVSIFQQNLYRNKDIVLYLKDKRGFTLDTIAKFKLGYFKNRITIPIFDEQDNLVNVRMYSPDKEPKIMPFRHGQGVQLYGVENLHKDAVLLCEGEFDRMLLEQNKFPTITSTGGANSFRREWGGLFEDKVVFLVYDNDIAGNKGEIRAATMLSDYTRAIYRVQWPSFMESKEDVTDFFVKYKRSKEDFQQLLKNSTKVFL